MYTYNISWSCTSLFHLFNSLPVILTYLSPNFMSSLHFYSPLNSTTSVAHMSVAEGGSSTVAWVSGDLPRKLTLCPSTVISFQQLSAGGAVSGIPAHAMLRSFELA